MYANERSVRTAQKGHEWEEKPQGKRTGRIVLSIRRGICGQIEVKGVHRLGSKNLGISTQKKREL